MKKVVMLVCLATAITGCAPLAPEGCQKKTALDSCSYKQSGKVSDKDIYGQQAAAIKKALDSALADPHARMVSNATCISNLPSTGYCRTGDKRRRQSVLPALADAATRATFRPSRTSVCFRIWVLPAGTWRGNRRGKPVERLAMFWPVPESRIRNDNPQRT